MVFKDFLSTFKSNLQKPNNATTSIKADGPIVEDGKKVLCQIMTIGQPTRLELSSKLKKRFKKVRSLLKF